MSRRISAAAAALALAALLLRGVVADEPAPHGAAVGDASGPASGPNGSGPNASGPNASGLQDAGPLAAGRYLVRIGDCAGCHALPGSTVLAGGRAIATPFGNVYSTNLTPDPKTGLGAWTPDDFWQAMHEGKSKDGRLLYPAFPYTSFTRITRADSDAIFAYLRSLPPVERARIAPDLRFPYDTQLALAAWRMLYFRPGEFEPDAGQSESWNRGAYLVEGLGHCGECHTPRDRLGGLERDDAYAGTRIPSLGWDAPPLGPRGDEGAEARAELAKLLRSGISARDAVAGPMAEVVFGSLAYLKPDDADAMVTFIESLPPPAAASNEAPVWLSQADWQRYRTAGKQLYAKHCADCHGDDGRGKPYRYPALATNPAVVADKPDDAIRSVLFGGFPPSTPGNPHPYGMPPFAQQLGDREIAEVLTYVRTAWGNRASAVAADDVRRR